MTADAQRTPGRDHALNPVPDRRGVYKALCGFYVTEESDDPFVGDNSIWPSSDPAEVECRRCRRALGLPTYRVDSRTYMVRFGYWLPWETYGERTTREAAEAVAERGRKRYPKAEFRIAEIRAGERAAR